MARKHSHGKKTRRTSMSLPSDLLAEFDRSMKKAGYTDRSKAIQIALHAFIDENDWKDESKNGAGTITLLYDNHTFNHDSASTQVQHRYSDIISATTHMHLSHEDCLETIMVRGKIKKIKELTKSLSEHRGIKSLKVHFVALV